MPGRTPADAFRAFIEPIEAAVSCLGVAKITPSPGGRTDAYNEHAWSLNGVRNGMSIAGGWNFSAAMQYKFVPHSEGWRVTTLRYIYSLSCGDEELWAIHWHPNGSSPERRTHLHAPIPGAGDRHVHRPIGRFTCEDAVEWAIGSGVPAARADWKDVLREGKEVHVQHRTWHADPPAVV